MHHGAEINRLYRTTVHAKAGGFDHAAVHTGLNRLYVAHKANDTLDVIDCVEDRYLHSIPNLTGVAGALVSTHGRFSLPNLHWLPDSSALMLPLSYGADSAGGFNICLFNSSRLRTYQVKTAD